MKFTPESFRAWQRKRITLLGMSGVGKTHLANLLRRADWFHYSGDYRIGTRYLNEHIIDQIKQQAMQVPFLCDLLRRDCSPFLSSQQDFITPFLRTFMTMRDLPKDLVAETPPL